jgi:NAD/NADP transhydrogenase alpha subunit
MMSSSCDTTKAYGECRSASRCSTVVGIGSGAKEEETCKRNDYANKNKNASSKEKVVLETINGQQRKRIIFALDCVPRMLSRGQAFDTLSSQANIAGYRVIIEAAEAFPRFFAGQMTAAGKVPPAKVLVLGAGVAGLAAVQTAKNMGAIVRAFDVRPVCKEQVESMGATFLEVNIQEDGSGLGGYAKEMLDAFKAAQEAALMMVQAQLMWT